MTAMTSPRLLRFRFVAAICAGSFLLFLVQPMVARMALPRLGGAPAVWNSAMLVYQALLLSGYAYAHFIGRLAPRAQAALHLALLLAAALMLPIGLSGAMPSASANPFFWVPYLFVASIGPLFFVISAQAPLLQRWYAQAGGGDPYPLYAASNLGSFGGLIAYPLIVEPLLPLKGQSWLWSGGYLLVIVLVGLCALVLPKAVPVERTTTTGRYDFRQVAMWIVLAAIPSGLMLSTTTHLTTDIVAMPLLWVLPLGLYLLSFSIAFSENRALPTAIVTIAPLILMIGGGVAFAAAATMPWFYASIGLILLFVVSIALHAMMYERRPAPELLTGFYLAMSAGGVLGGIFCALVAPVIFDWAYEHPVLIVAAGLLVAREPLFAPAARIPARIALILALVALIASLVSGHFLIYTEAQAIPEFVSLGIMILIVFIGLAVIGRRVPYALTLVALMLSLGGWNALKTSFVQQARTRSFFGIYTIGNSGGSRYLQHGTTLHGEQSLEAGRERDPLTYYAPPSGVGLAEVLADAVNDFTGGKDVFSGLPAGSRAVTTWNHKLESDFLDAFGRPNASQECPCERERKSSVVQALHLMNSANLQEKIATDTPLKKSSKPEPEVVRDLYLAAYNRLPKPNELKAALAYFATPGATRQTAIEDIMWSLLNSAEFVFNH